MSQGKEEGVRMQEEGGKRHEAPAGDRKQGGEEVRREGEGESGERKGGRR